MMAFPVDIAFHNMVGSPEVASRLKLHAEGLGRYHSHITACRVTVEEQASRHRKGKLFNLRIAIAIPGREIVVEHAHAHRVTHNDFHLAERDAFNAARRQLQNAVHRRRPKTADKESDAE
jgi:hypothetical protein